VAYDATGSGEGVRRVKSGQAVFAVSDVALSVPELQAGRLIQFRSRGSGFGRAQSRGLAAARLQNRAKSFVAPSKAGFQHAAAAFPWEQAPGFSVMLLDQPGEESWPITAPVFVILPIMPADVGAARQVLALFDWALREGEPVADRLGFVAMPPSLVKTVRLAWSRQLKGPDGRPLLGADQQPSDAVGVRHLGRRQWRRSSRGGRPLRRQEPRTAPPGGSLDGEASHRTLATGHH
jgi:hypothetical protein